jgi:hypothetical protein
VSYWRGFISAIVLLEWLALGWLLLAAPEIEAMVAEIGPSAQLPGIFVVVTSTGYALGCLVGLAAAAVLAGWLPRRPRARVLGLATVAIAMAGMIAVTWYGLYSPIFMLAGNVR